MRPYHDHENWITKWIRSKMVTPEDREKKLAAILGKMKNGADELCAHPAPPPPALWLDCGPTRTSRSVVRGGVQFSAGDCMRCLVPRLSIPHPLASQARQRRSLTGAGGCATTELCLGGQLEGGLGPMQGQELHTVPRWRRPAEHASGHVW